MVIDEPKEFLRHLTTKPGVYQMFGENDVVLYVGKARNLKQRLTSYFQPNNLSPKTRLLMSQAQRIEVTVTHENEALLLEHNLIKHFKPRFNVLLRDDKSYPYIYLSEDDEYPRLDFYRGKKRKNGRYFGPYPNVSAVRDTLNLLQKLFRIRQCENSFFRARTRPCLQYQIKRCTAPCVKLIDPETYQQDVKNTALFLEGKSNDVIEILVKKMEECSEKLEYERAAYYRDLIARLNHIKEKQYVSNAGDKIDIDVIALAKDKEINCVNILQIRNGSIINNTRFFPKSYLEDEPAEILQAFVSQYYLMNEFEDKIPSQILLSHELNENELIEKALAKLKGKNVAIQTDGRGVRAQWLKMSLENAQQALMQVLAKQSLNQDKLQALQQLFKLDNMPARIECFDVSHTMGEATVASCVVFIDGKPSKENYRRFNIRDVQAGDDYGALKQALLRRYTKQKIIEAPLPDILLIDGGKGQLHQAEMVLQELQIHDVFMAGIAKGPGRKAGLETLFWEGNSQGVQCETDSPALHLLQQIRDEAHRFAITGHRQQRSKARKISTLEQLEGIGPKRRRELLRYLGGFEEVKRASIEDLAKVPGISLKLAERIFEALHPN